LRSSFAFLTFHFVLERGERTIPELIEPSTNRAQTLGIDLIDAARSGGLVLDQARRLEHREMLRDGRARHRQAVRDLADRARPGGQPLEYLPPGRIGERSERGSGVDHD
jgi:hypothetical protein